MQKVLFLHGFFASGTYATAQALTQGLAGRAQVISPDLPLHPREALVLIEQVCRQEHPAVIVGNSNGAFLAQIAASRLVLPALLGNPHFEMTRFLTPRLGPHEYKAPRADDRQHFVIDQPLIDEFASLQQHQWDYCTLATRDRIWGIFGESDTLAHYEPLFLEHYTHAFHFPGAHTPTPDEVLRYYVPLVVKLLELKNEP
ncbi:YqiA/YcfP family alpha/beta fold hydrolase [Barnesiella sp. An55]|uniref:YqiA/YcfP family alpha/beta fold hydrolase n=1 Tax=Barnesiella sp. An55 TaxID=1965646 RepID=UPI000B393DBA|nr:YqiA/YcfP family alpha/beta fold hydrolase [Barnesiella sp. An55]OUN73754.1 hypothetical protein B5G10_04135 [Barnesiella sp. An55]